MDENAGALQSLIGFVLDRRWAGRGAAILAAVVALEVARAPVQANLAGFLSGRAVWRNYHVVSRILYAPLPLKLVAFQMLSKFAVEFGMRLEDNMRVRLVGVENSLMELAVPVTVGMVGEDEGS